MSVGQIIGMGLMLAVYWFGITRSAKLGRREGEMNGVLSSLKVIKSIVDSRFKDGKMDQGQIDLVKEILVKIDEL